MAGASEPDGTDALQIYDVARLVVAQVRALMGRVADGIEKNRRTTRGPAVRTVRAARDVLITGLDFSALGDPRENADRLRGMLDTHPGHGTLPDAGLVFLPMRIVQMALLVAIHARHAVPIVGPRALGDAFLAGRVVVDDMRGEDFAPDAVETSLFLADDAALIVLASDTVYDAHVGDIFPVDTRLVPPPKTDEAQKRLTLATLKHDPRVTFDQLETMIAGLVAAGNAASRASLEAAAFAHNYAARESGGSILLSRWVGGRGDNTLNIVNIGAALVLAHLMHARAVRGTPAASPERCRTSADAWARRIAACVLPADPRSRVRAVEEQSNAARCIEPLLREIYEHPVVYGGYLPDLPLMSARDLLARAGGIKAEERTEIKPDM